jgi:hypothetical protein
VDPFDEEIFLGDGLKLLPSDRDKFHVDYLTALKKLLNGFQRIFWRKLTIFSFICH